MALLELKGVACAYGRIQALRKMSIDVNKGEVVALIGSNGAGKTTTLRTISGLMHPQAGTIGFDGRDITTTGPARIVALGICQSPEGRRLFPRMTVQDNLFMGAYSRNDRPGIASDMERVFTLFSRLRERRAQVAGTLSGGEQQMLAIGRAMMASPRLLLLDEPSMGLAPVVVEQIFETIGNINRQGTTILLVEQNAAMALQIAHRGYVLETGTIVLTGTAAELAANADVRRAYLGE